MARGPARGTNRSASLASFLLGFMSVSTIGRRLGVCAPLPPSARFSTSCMKKGAVVLVPERTVPGAGWKADGLGAVGMRFIGRAGGERLRECRGEASTTAVSTPAAEGEMGWEGGAMRVERRSAATTLPSLGLAPAESR